MNRFLKMLLPEASRAYSCDSCYSWTLFLMVCVVAALVGGASAQSYTAVTEPIGFTKVVVPAATGGATSKRVLAVPYSRAGVFQGLVTAVGTNTMTFGSASVPVNFSNGQFTGSLHYAKVRKGSNAGRFFPITSHTNNTLTVNAGAASVSSVVAVNDTVEVFPAQTLGSLFGTSSVPFQTGADASTADVVRLFDGTQWTSYFHNGTSWRTAGNANSQDNVTVAPDQGVFVVCKGTGSVNLMLYGEVGVGRERSAIGGTTDTLLANRFPVQTTLQNLGINSLQGWAPGDAASVADNVMLWNGTGWDVFYYTGANWEKVGSFSSANATAITPTTAVMIHRKPGSTGQTGYLTSDPPFTNQ